MFKDARLQERIFDQIHAVEFKFDDDFRTAEVGSVLPVSGLHDDSFQRVDDSDIFQEAAVSEARAQIPEAAHVETFVDDLATDTFGRGSFERISDDEDTSEVGTATSRGSKKHASAEEGDSKRKRATKKSAAAGSGTEKDNQQA